MSKFRAGVLHGDEILKVYEDANKNNYAIPAVNVVGTNSVNAVIETAKKLNSPVIVQVPLKYYLHLLQILPAVDAFVGMPYKKNDFANNQTKRFSGDHLKHLWKGEG